MGASIPALRCFAAALALAGLLGCASAPAARAVRAAGRREPGLPDPAPQRRGGHASGARVLQPDHLARSSSAICGRTTSSSRRSPGRPRASSGFESIQQVRAGEKGARAGYDDAARALALELRKHAEFDAMIAPSLFVREAPIANRIRALGWRRTRARVRDARPRGAQPRRPTPLEGAAPAASLHVAVFDAKGEKLHEAKGGLDLLVRVRVDGNRSVRTRRSSSSRRAAISSGTGSTCARASPRPSHRSCRP